MADCRILILTAMIPEAQAIARVLRFKKVAAEIPLWRRDDLALAVVGMRAVRLPEVLKIEAIAHPAGMVMAGLAGGLASELSRGAVVVDGKNLPGAVLRGGARVGLIHTSESVVATPAAKAALLAKTGCIAVDMETAIARRFAAKNGAAFVAIRAISDTVRETLDPTLLTLVDFEGRVMKGRVLKLLMKEPGRLKSLLALGRTTKLVMGKLSEVLDQLLTSNWPGGSTKRQTPS